jgi:tetratricopeptide (TPR) repeat protein
VAVLLRRAKLYTDQLGRDDSALEDYQRVLDVDYGNVEALYAIAEIWRRRNDSNELVQALHQTIDRASSALPAENQIAIFRELGTIYQSTLNQPSDAIDAWRRLLAVDPRDFEAMAALENLLRAEERWVEVIEVKMGRAAAYEDPAEQVREYLEVASLWENQVGEKDRPRPRTRRSSRSTRRTTRRSSPSRSCTPPRARSEPLIELYLAATRRARTRRQDRPPPQGREGLRGEPRGQGRRRSTRSSTAFEMDFNDNETCRYLERMAAATSRWTELIQNVNGMLQAESEPSRRIALSLRLAKWYAEDLGHPEHAQPYYQLILSSTRTTWPCSGRWRTSSRRPAAGSSRARPSPPRAPSR